MARGLSCLAVAWWAALERPLYGDPVAGAVVRVENSQRMAITDGDGIANRIEDPDRNGFDAGDPSNWLRANTDGDGLDDYSVWRPSAMPGQSKFIIRRSTNTGVLLEVNAETDFVAKNDDFLALSAKLAELVATKNPVDVAALSAP